VPSTTPDSKLLRVAGVTLVLALALVFGGVLWPEPAATMPNSVRIPMKVPHGEGDPPDAALFSHWSHGRYHCYSCHPSIFPQRRLGFTHEDLDEGRFCARCHDGKTAFGVDDDDVECETCHRPPRWKIRKGRK